MSTTGPPRVLRLAVVADDPSAATAAARALATAGLPPPVTTTTTSSGPAALADRRHEVVLLVVPDTGLPDDLVAAIVRAAGAAPVVALVTREDVGADVVAAGAHDFVDVDTSGPARLAHTLRLAERDGDAQRLVRSHADALARASDRLSHFVSTTAHDLRAPLVNAEAWTQLAREGRGGDLDEVLERVLRNLAAQHEVIETQLALYRGLDLSREVVDPSALVAAVAQTVGIAEMVEVDGSLPTVLASPPGLRSVVQNLLVNARAHATPPSGELRVVVTGRTVGEEVLLRIDDNGPGIPLKDRETVFTRGTTSVGMPGDASGHGLGLAGARTTMEAMAGLLWATEGTLGGAGMVLALPAAEQDATGS